MNLVSLSVLLSPTDSIDQQAYCNTLLHTFLHVSDSLTMSKRRKMNQSFSFTFTAHLYTHDVDIRNQNHMSCHCMSCEEAKKCLQCIGKPKRLENRFYSNFLCFGPVCCSELLWYYGIARKYAMLSLSNAYISESVTWGTKNYIQIYKIEKCILLGLILTLTIDVKLMLCQSLFIRRNRGDINSSSILKRVIAMF